ncbi:MAG: hypothetical protein ACYTEK_04430 [Planctomycetota bacterium]
MKLQLSAVVRGQHYADCQATGSVGPGQLVINLQQAELLLGADEEFVLSGLYYRNSGEE